MQPAIHTLRFDVPTGWWEIASMEPPADLATVVESVWTVRGRMPFAREEILPSGRVELMFNLGGCYRVVDRENGFGGHRFRAAWISGLQESPITIEPEFDAGLIDSEHVALTLTPFGARRLFGLPMSELRGQVWELEVLLNQLAADLHEQLLASTGLNQRFGLLIRWAREVLGQCDLPCDARVRHVHHMLQRSHGQMRIAGLCQDLGVSRSWLARRFNDRVGMSPKRFARVLKFQNLLQRVESQPQTDWTTLAQDCGYYDQAHLIRDFKALAGRTPSDYLKRRAPGGGSVVID